MFISTILLFFFSPLHLRRGEFSDIFILPCSLTPVFNFSFICWFLDKGIRIGFLGHRLWTVVWLSIIIIYRFPQLYHSMKYVCCYNIPYFIWSQLND
jgi:hypothetical protein